MKNTDADLDLPATLPAALPVVALTLGDPAGIGAELIARLLARKDLMAQANVVLMGDRWLWVEGQRLAGMSTETATVTSLAEVRGKKDQF